MSIIVRAAHTDELTFVRELFIEYQAWLGIDLCFQGFDEELRTLPGAYASPQGAIFLALYQEQPVGCVAIRPKTRTEAELKRLYVRPAWQGKGAGRRLLLAAMAQAKAVGYASVVLDTLPSMQAAKSLYLDYGFTPADAYYHNPIDGVEYYRYLFPPRCKVQEIN